MKISQRDPATMTAGQINRELDKLDAYASALNDKFIEAGREQEKIWESLKKDDPLSQQLKALTHRRWALRREIEIRYGPDAPWRLPTGRGFGARHKGEKEKNGVAV